MLYFKSVSILMHDVHNNLADHYIYQISLLILMTYMTIIPDFLQTLTSM
jgi:hypothetical protein